MSDQHPSSPDDPPGWATPPTGPPRYPPAYPPPVTGPYAAPSWEATGPKTNGLAIASLICGIASIVTCSLAGIAGIITGVKARRQLRDSGGAETGEGLATAGIVTSIIGLAILVLAIIFVIVVIVLTTVLAPPSSQSSRAR